jgi:ABC-type glycerol-3-phosphate transport system substrate-binding protein
MLAMSSHRETATMRGRAVLLSAVLVLAPLGVRAADLVVWWDEGFYAEEAEAVRETVAAFEQRTGKQVELVFHPEGEHPEAIVGGAGGRQAARLRLRLPC